MSKKKKKEEQQTPNVNRELEGFDIKIDSFGEIKSTIKIEDINHFLNRNVDDKKLRDREDLEELKKGKKKKGD